MSRREDYEQQTEALLEPIVEELGFELVDVEYVKEGGTWYLRAYIDKPGGIAVMTVRQSAGDSPISLMRRIILKTPISLK